MSFISSILKSVHRGRLPLWLGSGKKPCFLFSASPVVCGILVQTAPPLKSPLFRPGPDWFMTPLCVRGYLVLSSGRASQICIYINRGKFWKLMFFSLDFFTPKFSSYVVVTAGFVSCSRLAPRDQRTHTNGCPHDPTRRTEDPCHASRPLPRYIFYGSRGRVQKNSVSIHPGQSLRKARATQTPAEPPSTDRYLPAPHDQCNTTTVKPP